jgi:hypothetical protein
LINVFSFVVSDTFCPSNDDSGDESDDGEFCRKGAYVLNPRDKEDGVDIRIEGVLLDLVAALAAIGSRGGEDSRGANIRRKPRRGIRLAVRLAKSRECIITVLEELCPERL